MTIKAGEMARIRVSGEDVFVLELGDTQATIRRPQVGQEGIVHKVETFTPGELCTPEEFRAQMLADRLAMRAQLAQLGDKGKDDLADQMYDVQ